MQHIFNAKTNMIPVIIANLTISKSFKKYLKKVPGQNGKQELQKIAMLGPVRIKKY